MAFSSEPKNRSSPLARDVERLDAHAVAGQNQALARFGPQRQSEHAAQPRKTIRVPFEKRGQNRLGIGAGAKPMAAAFQFAAQFRMVVNFAVEDDDRIAVFRNRWAGRPIRGR